MKCQNCGNRTKFFNKSTWRKRKSANKRRELGLCYNCYCAYKEEKKWDKRERLASLALPKEDDIFEGYLDNAIRILEG